MILIIWSSDTPFFFKIVAVQIEQGGFPAASDSCNDLDDLFLSEIDQLGEILRSFYESLHCAVPCMPNSITCPASRLKFIKMLSLYVFATPIYYYEMSGQMKTLLDRANPLYFSDYRFRDAYLLATSADEDESAMDGAEKGLQGWVSCFEKVRLAGVVRCTDTDALGAVRNAAKALETAYELGKNV